MNDNTIGDRLRMARRERGLTQEELAARAGVSRDIVAKLEQNQRRTARITTLTRLSNALDVSLSGLLGKREQIERDDGGGILAVRNALLAVNDLPGIDLAVDDGEATPLAELNAAVDRGWGHYWQGEFGDLAAMLPGLIGEARISARAAGAPARKPLAQAYQLAADLMVHVGNDDLAAIGAERALAAAHQGDDELQHATLAGTMAWVYLHQARPGDAERLARVTAEKIEPAMSKATPAHLTVWGGLLLWAAAAAAAASKAPEVADYIGLARSAAGRFEQDRHDYQVSFGTTQVAMQATHTFSVLGHPSEALRAAAGVRRSDLLQISYGAHQLDVAQACVDARRGQDAAGALWRAHSVSAEWFRHQGLARNLVADVVEHERRLTPVMRKLADSVGIQ